MNYIIIRIGYSFSFTYLAHSKTLVNIKVTPKTYETRKSVYNANTHLI